MLDTPAERNALLASLISHHSGLVARQSRGDEDDMQDLLLKLLGSSPDFLVPELAGYEIGQIDAKIDAVREKLARSPETSKRHAKLLAQLGKLHQERDQIHRQGPHGLVQHGEEPLQGRPQPRPDPQGACP